MENQCGCSNALRIATGILHYIYSRDYYSGDRIHILFNINAYGFFVLAAVSLHSSLMHVRAGACVCIEMKQTLSLNAEYFKWRGAFFGVVEFAFCGSDSIYYSAFDIQSLDVSCSNHSVHFLHWEWMCVYSSLRKLFSK